MKKSLSIILSLAMVCTMSATAFAADSSTDLSAIADATIQVRKQPVKVEQLRTPLIIWTTL